MATTKKPAKKTTAKKATAKKPVAKKVPMKKPVPNLPPSNEMIKKSGNEIAYLVTCRVCKGKVSSAAIACPHCGDPQKANVEKNCSDCGKVITGKVHKNMRGEFAEWILCDVCYNKYKTELENKWEALYKYFYERDVSLRRSDLSEYEKELLRKQVLAQHKRQGEIIEKIAIKYHNLTGTNLKSLSYP